MNPDSLILLVILAGCGLVLAVWGMWHFWKKRPSKVRQQIASEAERWLQGQHGDNRGDPDRPR
jgi:hypothetical protein